MSLSPYLLFGGNCREAFDYYRSVFGGEFAICMTFGDAPPDMNVPDEAKDAIMHVSLPVGSSVLMGSDILPTMGPPRSQGNNFSITVEPESREHADKLFAGLSDGGTVSMPMEDVFWGDYFGSCTDRFGNSWMVTFTPKSE